ncbi:MAG: hypothetical protein IBX68_07940 [Dehalococcoidia bacterium]|nr:hypothetical protein [Dehalococcoidia bacterium]
MRLGLRPRGARKRRSGKSLAATAGVSLALFPKMVYAESSSGIPPLVASIITKLCGLVDNVLGHWVSGGTVTDPWGEKLLVSLATTGINTADYLDRLLALSTPPSIGRKATVLVDGVLGHWVDGHELTESGELLVISLGTIAVNTVDFLACLLMPFRFS